MSIPLRLSRLGVSGCLKPNLTLNKHSHTVQVSPDPALLRTT